VLVSKEYRAMTLHCVLQTNSQYCGGSNTGGQQTGSNPGWHRTTNKGKYQLRSEQLRYCVSDLRACIIPPVL